MALDVLVVGGGGREHALVRSLRRSPRLGRLLVAPGNAGMEGDAERVPIDAEDGEALADTAQREGIDLTVVGPEAPLVGGIVDVFRSRGLTIFGPEREAALLEGSKSFAKEVMRAAGVPTANAEHHNTYESALSRVRERGAPIVVKADGLAAGKGVTVAGTVEEAEEALRACFVDRRFGSSGDSVLLEECLEGEELSLLAIVSDGQVLPLAPAQDYKPIFDDNRGPNTGGMGCYSPVPSVSGEMYARIVETIIRPTVNELQRRGFVYRGVLYAGLMLTEHGPYVLEFNCRFGDPEAQAQIPRLQSDMLELLWAAARGEEIPAEAKWSEGPCVGVVMASRGYPASSSKGDVITGLEDVASQDGTDVFHAGTAHRDGDLVTDGGRILAVSALGKSFAEARARAYEGVGKIRFDGAQYRSDIGRRAEEWEREGRT